MRTFVMGDPQAPFAKVLDVLARHAALDGDRLAPDVTLISIGDHFDYDFRDPATCTREGLAVLRWFASHPPEQVHILLGNHDISRVMELAALDDATFAAARELARAQDAHAADSLDAPLDPGADFAARYPELPPPGVIGRDYASFSTEQRALVIELLLAGRFRLALVGELAGRDVLVTHAAVTEREVAMLGVAAEPHAIAAALEQHLATAIAAVRDDWQRGVITPLSLEPLHRTGGAGREGGGLLYHRPSNPATGATFDPERPRRFDPHTLPRGLAQIAGHSGHAKCVQELGPWCTPAARARKHGGVRSLVVDADEVVYDLGVAHTAPTVLIMIDGELRRVPATEVALLELDRVR